MKRRAFNSSLAGLCTVALPGFVSAQDYPTRPIRMILGFSPGGSGDFIARTLGEEVTKLLGQSIVIENRPGAGSNLASDAVAKSAPDGYTVLLGGSFSHSVNPALFAKLPFDPVKDFVPITKVAALPTVFAVPQTLPVATLREFMAWARKEGDKVSFASSGIGSPGHIAGGYFNQAAGLQMAHVPYKGSSDAVRALIAGEVALTITSPTSVMAFVKSGRLKALALTTPGRSALVPGVPGADEAGLPNFNLTGWYGLWAPAGTPASTVTKLHGAFLQALSQPAMVSKFEAQGASLEPSASPQAFAAWAREDAAQWFDIVKKSGATVG